MINFNFNFFLGQKITMLTWNNYDIKVEAMIRLSRALSIYSIPHIVSPPLLTWTMGGSTSDKPRPAARLVCMTLHEPSWDGTRRIKLLLYNVWSLTCTWKYQFPKLEDNVLACSTRKTDSKSSSLYICLFLFFFIFLFLFYFLHFEWVKI